MRGCAMEDGVGAMHLSDHTFICWHCGLFSKHISSCILTYYQAAKRLYPESFLPLWQAWSLCLHSKNLSLYSAMTMVWWSVISKHICCLLLFGPSNIPLEIEIRMFQLNSVINFMAKSPPPLSWDLFINSPLVWGSSIESLVVYVKRCNLCLGSLGLLNSRL